MIVAGKSVPDAVGQIIVKTLEDYGVSAERLYSRDRRREAVQVRHAIMRRLLDEGYSYGAVGRWLDRTPALVMYAVGTGLSLHRSAYEPLRKVAA